MALPGYTSRRILGLQKRPVGNSFHKLAVLLAISFIHQAAREDLHFLPFVTTQKQSLLRTSAIAATKNGFGGLLSEAH